NFEGGEIPGAKQALIDIDQIAILAGRNRFKNMSLKCAEPVVDMAHGCCAMLLVVTHDSRAIKLHVAIIELALLAVNPHQTVCAAPAECRLHVSIVANQIRIAVKHEELFGQ